MLGPHQQLVIERLRANSGGLVVSRLDVGITQRNVVRVCERLESLGIVKITVRRLRDRSGDLVELRTDQT